MSQKKKSVIILGSVCACLILLVIVLSQFVAVSNLFNWGDPLCVVFDKADVMGADRIVVREGENVITITDKELVREIASEFVVANRQGLCDSCGDYIKTMEIYNGGKLVRNIQWNGHDDIVAAYEVDDTHWMFPSETDVGQITLSREFMERFNEILAAHRG